MFERIKEIFFEFKQRKVFRVAAVYSGIAFIIIQIISDTFAILGIPDWISKYTIIALLIGFPIATGLAWAFDITDKGIVKTKNKPAGLESQKPLVGNNPLIVVVIIATFLAIWGWWNPTSHDTPQYQAIAVLPLDNYMGDPDQDYFVDGMTESIIAELARLKGLRVISRTSAMRFRNSEMSIPEIAASLGVDAIVEGSVLKADNDIRITAQLIDGRQDIHLWAKTFDRDFSQILSLQRDVAKAIAEEIKWKLLPEEQDRLNEQAVVNSEAYQLYLKGLFYRFKEKPEALAVAYDLFKQAIQLDPNLAEAYAALVVTHYLQSDDPFENKAFAHNAAEKAVALNPDSPEAQLAMALYRELFILDFENAETAFLRSIELNSGNAETRREYGLFLWRMGRLEEAREQLEMSRSYDPMSPHVLRDLGVVNLWSGRMEEGHALIKTSFELAPEVGSGDWGINSKLALSYLAINQPEKALEMYEAAGKPLYWSFAWLIYERLGQSETYFTYVDSFLKNEDNTLTRAYLNSTVGRTEKSLAMLRKMIREHSPRLVAIRTFTGYDKITSTPEYKAILNDLGFPDIKVKPFSQLLDELYGPAPEVKIKL